MRGSPPIALRRRWTAWRSRCRGREPRATARLRGARTSFTAVIVNLLAAPCYAALGVGIGLLVRNQPGGRRSRPTGAVPDAPGSWCATDRCTS